MVISIKDGDNIPIVNNVDKDIYTFKKFKQKLLNTFRFICFVL